VNDGAVRRIGVTLGDPNGIGPEIAVKAALAEADARLLLIGDPKVVQHYAAGRAVREVDPASPPPAEPGVIDLVPVRSLPGDAFAPGRCDAASGRAMVAYTERAVTMAHAGQIDEIGRAHV
jgi:4-hydroxythreonine-4-phosphate dehydrogenase